VVSVALTLVHAVLPKDLWLADRQKRLGTVSGPLAFCRVLWNTIYMEAALNQLRLEGYQVYEADVAKLSPLIHDHINMLGRYSFAMPETVARGELRPLRNPAVDQE
jgi:hypothetical protein